MLKSLRPYSAFESEERVKRQRVQYTPILYSSGIMQKIWLSLTLMFIFR